MAILKQQEKCNSKNKRKSKIRTALYASTFLAVGLFAGNMALAQSDAGKEYNIPPSDMSEALQAFSEQSDAEIIYAEKDVAEKTTKGVEGEYSRERALEEIIGDSGLVYEVSSDGVIIIRTAFLDVKQAGVARQFRVAQADRAASQRIETIDASEADDPIQDEDTGRDEIIVTGTSIRGSLPVGSPLIVLDRTEIERTGLATTQQIIQTLPQNFGGGNNATSGQPNRDAGTGINLRGLGNVATLTLLNGRRIPAAGTRGDFVDLSTIPASAIERIEVLPDGASAIYGADAIAGVVNIILRDDFDGAETRLRFGTVTDGGLREYQAAQTIGKTWVNGRASISYEYFNRSSLASADRDFAASSDLTSLGGDNFNDFFSNPGNILDPGTFFTASAFAIPEGQDGTSLTVSDLLPGQVNEGNRNEGSILLPEENRHSIFIAAKQSLGASVEFFAEGRYNNRDFENVGRGVTSTLIVPSTNPFFVDPFGGSPSIRIGYNFADDLGPATTRGNTEEYGAVFGSTADLWGDWQAEVFSTYSKRNRDFLLLGQFDALALNAALADPNPATAFNPFGAGSNTNPATLQFISDTPRTQTESELYSAHLVANGSLFRLPGGDVKLAAGFEYRDESLESQGTNATFGNAESSFGRNVVAFFSEIYLPLFSDQNSKPGLEHLEVSASVRHEDYGGGTLDISSTNPKVGVRWSPMLGLDIRGSYGTSFRTPTLSDLDTANRAAVNLITLWPDPQSSTGFTNTLLVAGNNPNLDSETARTWTVGADFTPESAKNFSASFTYFNIMFEDRIARPANVFGVLTEADRFVELINRNPTQSELDVFCNSPVFESDPALCTAGSVGLILDLRLKNTASTKVTGFDFATQYRLQTPSLGNFEFRLNGNYLLDFEEALTPTSPRVELVNTLGNPIDFKLRGSATWDDGNALSGTVFVNYSGGYIDNVSLPERGIDSWTTVDLTLSYNLQNSFGEEYFRDTVFSINVQNLFDNDPPFANNGPLFVGYDPANATPLNRFISFNVIKNW